MRFPLALVFLMVSLPGVAQERITLEDGSVLTAFVLVPVEAAPDQGYPLAILMGGGSGNAAISRDTAGWLGTGFAERGWLVAVPISPNNRSFRGGLNNAKIEQLTRALQQRDDARGGKVLLAGISNGGLSALELARRNPVDYFGVVAVPALSAGDTDNSALDGFPVYLRIGSEDQLGWANRFDETVESLSSAGVKLDADILYGAPHMFAMDWASLEPWLEQFLVSADD